MNRFLTTLVTVATLAAATSAKAQTADVPLYDDLGSHHYPISTRVPLTQRYFDQGLRLYYAFNHAEAIRAFDQASRLDPSCAICRWGTALAHGPNINLPMDSAAGAAAYAALRDAQRLAPAASAKERDLIAALATRYAAVPPADRAALDTAYARAMGKLADRYPDDLDLAALHAEAIMDLSPWNYWTRDGKARPDTRALLARLERVLAADADHPGANHFFIHAVEAVDPGRAVPMAERLAGLMPGAGHLVHMPGHIYVRVGRYHDAIAANRHAVHADETWIQDQAPAVGMYTLGYYPHNYDFLAFAASMIGHEREAIEASDRMKELIPEEMLRAPGMTVLQHFLTRNLQMRVRFGAWEGILAAPAPAEDLPYAQAIWHYARGRALAARGEVKGAKAELAAVSAAAADPRLAAQRVEPNDAGRILTIAREALAGHVAAAEGRMDEAESRLRAAVAAEDELLYGEPPEWSVPVRQELGALLLVKGDPAGAEEAFREDLVRHPENGWGLHGLARALAAQGKGGEAEEVWRRFESAWSGADHRLAEW